MFDINGKTIVVIGGNGYLGNSLCKELIIQKANVISLDKKKRSTALAKSKKNINHKYWALNTDITKINSIKKSISEIRKKYKLIDAVVFSVTTKPNDFYMPFVNCSIDGWKKVIDVELNGAFNICKEFGKIMEKQNYGNIIFISSIYGVVGNDQRIYQGSNLNELYLKNSEKSRKNKIFSHAAYPTVKGGLISLCRYLAAYWGERNIRVNCLSPGGIEHKEENMKFVRAYSKKVPLSRKAKVEDLTGAIIFLLSDESSYMTGHNLIVDGGYTIW